jgi:hypothetical protein
MSDIHFVQQISEAEALVADSLGHDLLAFLLAAISSPFLASTCDLPLKKLLIRRFCAHSRWPEQRIVALLTERGHLPREKVLTQPELSPLQQVVHSCTTCLHGASGLPPPIPFSSQRLAAACEAELPPKPARPAPTLFAAGSAAAKSHKISAYTPLRKGAKRTPADREAASSAEQQVSIVDDSGLDGVELLSRLRQSKSTRPQSDDAKRDFRLVCERALQKDVRPVATNPRIPGLWTCDDARHPR